MTALKSLLDNSVIHLISMLVSVECIFPVNSFLLLLMMSDFHLKPGHFEY